MNVTETLNQLFKNLEEKDKFSGVVLITRGETELYSGAFGYASRAWKIRNSLDIRFDTASITKLFTAAAILQLIDKKMLAFETRVMEYLGLEGTRISNDVNVFHLLTHTSGIGDDCEEEDGEKYEDLWKVKPNYSVRVTEDFLPQFVHKEPNFCARAGLPVLQLQFCFIGIDD